MCGFAGYLDLQDNLNLDRFDLTRMTESLLHRGPDASGYFVEDAVGIGFRRLSIIDLESGNQPLYNEDGSLVLVCNGEIFNYVELRQQLIAKGHRLSTNSDVEVLLHLYEDAGVDMLGKLNGQFSLAIYNRRDRTLFLARDQVGVNPLYWTVADDIFIFASEIKAILQHPSVRREVDLTGMDQIFSFPGLVSPRTMFAGIESLKSGNYLIVRHSKVKVFEYWDLEYPRIGECSDGKPERFYVDGVRERLVESVRFRLRSDVPVGFYLSGGLDSSLIAALVRRVSPELSRHSFSVAFTDSEKELSERCYQALMSRAVNSIHHEIMFDWGEISRRLSTMVYHSECPVKESYNTCSLALSELTRRAGIKVVLTGEGSDELFAGYVGYRFDQFGTRKSQSFDLDTVLQEEANERLWGDRNLFYEKDQRNLNETKSALYSSAVNDRFDDFDCLNFELVDKTRLQGRHPIHQRSYLDFKLRLADHLLSDHGDRMALANSVEARYPFLDIGLIEFTSSIPPNLKVNGLTEKYVLKRVAADEVPSEIVRREKFGFRAPGSPYLLQQNIEWVNDMLSYERIRRQGYFNPDAVERLKSRYAKPGFKLNPHLEDDLLMVVLTFGVLLDTFSLPSLN